MRNRPALTLTGLLLALAACSPESPAVPAPSPTSQPAPPTAMPMVPEPSALATAPGQWCATSRLGRSFTEGGVTYTCKGPKPYRWLP